MQPPYALNRVSHACVLQTQHIRSHYLPDLLGVRNEFNIKHTTGRAGGQLVVDIHYCYVPNNILADVSLIGHIKRHLNIVQTLNHYPVYSDVK